MVLDFMIFSLLALLMVPLSNNWMPDLFPLGVKRIEYSGRLWLE
jgi:hypothetical protein